MSLFGEAIRRGRELRGVSGAELARRVGVARQNLGAVERGRRPCSEALLVAAARELGMRPSRLVALGEERSAG